MKSLRKIKNENNRVSKHILTLAIIVIVFAVSFWITPVHAHRVQITAIGNYDEYLQYLEDRRAAPQFVHYEHIKQIGAFTGFYSEGADDTTQPAYDYRYCVTDENHYQFFVGFYKKSTYTPQMRTVHFPLQDMREANNAPKDYIKRGPLLYVYNHDSLSTIGCYLGDTVMSIRVFDNRTPFEDYPMNGERTIMSRLLSRNYFVALAAYYELIGDMPLQPGETWFSRMQYIIWPVVALILLIAACIAVVWIFLRIRSKKKAMSPTQWHNDRCNRKRIRKDNSSLQKEATRTDHD